jgi:uncharacterized repeat protein (TIGR01451 family)
MFEKLLSLVPYNPGLLHQLSFYGQRMREEASIRRLGVFFVALAFIVQFAAVMSPPQQAAAATGSSNDLIRGGFSSREDAYNHCMGGISGEEYGSIMHDFGVKCADIKTADSKYITVGGNSNNYYSMGRTSYGAKNPTTGKSTNEHAYPGVPKNGTLYARHLSSFYGDNNAQEHVLEVHASTGHTVYLMYVCGNIVTSGLPVEATVIEATPLPTPTPPAPTPPAPAPPAPTPPVTCPAGQINYGGTCYPPCPGNPAVPYGSSGCQLCPFNSAIGASDAQCPQPCPYNQTLPANSPQCFKPCPYNNAIPADNASCKPCDKSTGQQDALACVVLHKKALNSTQNIVNANNTTAQPNDVIVYTLSAENTGKADIDKYTFQESLGDVLDYADVVDLHGGNMDKNNIVSWPVEKIKAGNIAGHQITVKVKNPIPSTPVGTSNTAQFDLIMTNTYGDTINIKVPAPPIKAIQAAATNLPNTGPGATIILAASVVMISGYFYGRARLLAKESVLAIQENNQADTHHE